MIEKLKLYLVLSEFPVLLQDTIRCFLCVFSISLLSQDDMGYSNVRTNSSKNFSICANYLLLLIDCVLFYFIKLNRITLILMLRIVYLLVSVSLIMFLLSNQQTVTRNCCALQTDRQANGNRDLLIADSVNSPTRLPAVLAPNRTTTVPTTSSGRVRIKKKKVRIVRGGKSDAIKNCSKKASANQPVATPPLNLTSVDFYSFNGRLNWLSDYHTNMQQYLRYTEIALIVLSMLCYSLSIFAIDIHFFQKPVELPAK